MLPPCYVYAQASNVIRVFLHVHGDATIFVLSDSASVEAHLYGGNNFANVEPIPDHFDEVLNRPICAGK